MTISGGDFSTGRAGAASIARDYAPKGVTMQRNIYVPDDDTWPRIVAAAKAAGESTSEYLRRAAEERIERERKRLERRIA